MARYEEERYGGQRGSTRRGGFGERGRDEDFEQQERERYRSSEYGREYGGERGRGGYEGRGQGEHDYGRSLGSRELGEGYEDEDTYVAGGREGNRYGTGYDQGERGQGRWGSPRYGQGSQGAQGSQGYYPGGQGYGTSGTPGYGASPGYGQTSRYGPGSQGYDEGTWRGGPGRGSQGTWGGQPYGQGGRGGSMQADGWSGEPDEMRWGRQQGLYGSSEYGGYISSQRSQSEYQSHVGKGPKGWQRSDERIREEVNEALARHPDIDASDVEVRVQGAEVTLTGTVDDRRAKRLAEDVVERVFGVKDVTNQIKVSRSGSRFGERDVTARADREATEIQEPQQTRRGTAGPTASTTR